MTPAGQKHREADSNSRPWVPRCFVVSDETLGAWDLFPFLMVKTRKSKCRRCRSRNKNVWDLMPKRAVGTQS